MDVRRIAKPKRRARGRSSLAHWPASRTLESRSPRKDGTTTRSCIQSGGGKLMPPRLSAWETISLNYCYGYDVAIGEPTCPAPLEAAHVRRVHLAPHARNACAPVERRSAATAQQFSAAWARPDLNRLIGVCRCRLTRDGLHLMLLGCREQTAAHQFAFKGEV